MRKMEVLSPAGDMDRLITAVRYGADAVYLAGTSFGMRAAAGNFTPDELRQAMRYAHTRGVRIYVTCNTVPNESEIEAIPEFLELLEDVSADGVIVTDIGVMSMCRRYAPHVEMHVSTQAGVMNSETAKAFYDLGAKRAVLAREMSMADIAKLRSEIPDDMDIEAFCHGAMCVSFSGRCLLSNYLTGRDANRGECAQPCRWKYYLVEEKRPGEYMQISEDNGTFIFNSRDMCMIDHVKEMYDAGISSIKIEGRTKSSYYVASVTSAYRHAVDAAEKGTELEQIWKDEVYKVSHREYSTGFYFGYPGQYTKDSEYYSTYDVAAVVDSCDETGNAVLHQRNRFFPGDELEILMPGKEPVTFTAGEIRDSEGSVIEAARHADMELHMSLPVPAPQGSFLRKMRDSQ
ncbi:MAG: U32 family peptidase [Oscillospiraceae bacterium]|nr:U32 family peptidase [Oscillospiraceae bacterium]